MKERFTDLLALRLVIALGVVCFAVLNFIVPLWATSFAIGWGVALLGNWWNWDNLQKLTDCAVSRRKAQQIALSGYLANLLLMIISLGVGGYLGLNLFAIAGGLLVSKLTFISEEFLRKVFVRV